MSWATSPDAFLDSQIWSRSIRPLGPKPPSALKLLSFSRITTFGNISTWMVYFTPWCLTARSQAHGYAGQQISNHSSINDPPFNRPGSRGTGEMHNSNVEAVESRVEYCTREHVHLDGTFHTMVFYYMNSSSQLLRAANLELHPHQRSNVQSI
jgi:hypothetical protein